jgi:hypothetical protein
MKTSKKTSSKKTTPRKQQSQHNKPCPVCSETPHAIGEQYRINEKPQVVAYTHYDDKMKPGRVCVGKPTGVVQRGMMRELAKIAKLYA